MRSLKLLPLTLAAFFLTVQVAPQALAGPEQGWLGVVLGQRDGGPIEVFSVFSESPAESAGLMAGDVVLAVNGTQIEYDRNVTLKKVLGGRAPGDRVRLRIERDGRERTVRVRLGERPADVKERMREYQLKRERAELSEKEHELRERAHELREQAHEHQLKARELQEARKHSMQQLRGLKRELRDEYRLAQPRPRLGVAVETIDGQLAEYFETEPGSLLIREVIEGSAAEDAGLRAGDVILRVDGVVVGTLSELRRALDRHAEGGSAELEVLRRGAPHAFRAVLDGVDADEPASRVRGSHSRTR